MDSSKTFTLLVDLFECCFYWSFEFIIELGKKKIENKTNVAEVGLIFEMKHISKSFSACSLGTGFELLITLNKLQLAGALV